MPRFFNTESKYPLRSTAALPCSKVRTSLEILEKALEEELNEADEDRFTYTPSKDTIYLNINKRQVIYHMHRLENFPFMIVTNIRLSGKPSEPKEPTNPRASI